MDYLGLEIPFIWEVVVMLINELLGGPWLVTRIACATLHLLNCPWKKQNAPLERRLVGHPLV